MTKLPKPAITAVDVLLTAAGHVKEPLSSNLKNEAVKCALTKAEKAYEDCIADNHVHTIAASHDIAGVVPKVDAIKIYGKLGKLPYKSSTYRGYLLDLAARTKCAYCGHNTPSELDHYLPKSRFAEYAFSPINLIPSCAHCNSVSHKGEHSPTCVADTLFHPYFDDADDERWLYVKLWVERNGIVAKYYAQKPHCWTSCKFDKISFSFKKFGLSEVYAMDIISNLNSLRTSLGNLYAFGAISRLKEFFSDNSRFMLESSKNNWIGVAYEFIANDENLCRNYPAWFPDNTQITR